LTGTPLSIFSPETIDEMKAGRKVINCDAKKEPRTTPFYEAAYRPYGFDAYVAIPLLREGRWASTFWVSMNQPRVWSQQEVALLETIAERAWSAFERARLNAALHEREEGLRSLAENVPSILMRYDANFRVLYLNPKAAEITGIPNDEFIGKTNREVGMPEHLCVLWENAVQEVFRTGQNRDLEFDFSTKQGQKTFYIKLAPEFSLGGGVKHVLGISTDITHRKHMEESLRQSEEKFRIFAENTHDMESWINPEGKFVFISPSSKQVTGHDPGEFIENPGLWNNIIHPEDFPIFDRHRKEKERLPQEISFRIIHADGSIRWIGHVCQRVFNEEGRFLGIRGSNRDITERKQMEEELRKSHDELEIRVQERTRELREQSKVLDSFFKFSITPFVILDKDFNFIRVNEAYAKACHREVSEFIGHNHFEFYPSDAKAKFEQVVQTKKPYGAIARPFNFPDHPEWGTTYWNWTLTPVLDDTGEVEYLALSLEDVTKRKQAEEAIKEERQRFNDVLEILPAYLILLAPDYHVAFANRFFRERFGESHGKRCFEYLFGRSEPCEICQTYTVLKTMAPHKWEWTGPDSRIYDVSDFPFTDADGSTLILEMGIDITERKQAEKALQRHMQMVDLANDSIVIFNLDDRIIYWNKGAERLYGWKREEALGQQIHMLLKAVYPIPLEDIKESLYRRGHMEMELVHTKKDGTKVSVESRWTLQQDETGRAIAFLEINNDITERKRMEEELRAISLYARGLIEASPDPLVTISTNGKVMDVNKATELATGVSRKDLIGSNFSDYFSEPDRAKKGYEKVFSEGFVKDYPLAIRHTSGHITDVLYNATVYRNEAGEVQGVFAAARDITEYKRAEEALRESENRLRSLSSQLLSVQENERRRISREIHDSLGQSLSAIKFKIENITHQIHEGGYKEMLEPLLPIIQESIEESRRIQMDLRPSILDDLGIIATLTWFSREFQKIYSNIRVDKEIEIIENEVPDTLKTVIYRISQEALNNIAKHSQADSVRLSLRKAAGLIELAIRDNGKGFDPERTLPADGPRKGLGLTSMRERAELAGGTFAIESTPGKGTIIKASWGT
jgi:PAS domain S-box-containing protein